MQKENPFLPSPMAIYLRSLHYLILLFLSSILLASAQDENQFIYNGFLQAKLHLGGTAEIHRNGLLQLTNTTEREIGHAFYRFPIKFNTTSSLSFSTNFVFAMVPEAQNVGGHGMAFTISPSTDFSGAQPKGYLGLFNSSTNGLPTNHILAVELDSFRNSAFGDIGKNDVGIDVNGLKSLESAPAMYFSYEKRANISLELLSGNPMHLWIDYDEGEKLLNVTLAPTGIPKPNQPLLSTPIDLSRILLKSMYVGFSSATGVLKSAHYILGWSFNKSGPAQSLEIANLPPVPRQRKRKEELGYTIITSVVAAVVVLTSIIGAAYIVRRKRYVEIREDWEEEYCPHRFRYKDLYKATKCFKATELLGKGGFGKVYRGILPSSNVQIAVKKISHDSKQGMKEFVAEIVCMGRLRHRNLVQLLGYCRRKGELILVYDYMPNGSLDKFLYSDEKPVLKWLQRFRIIRGVASGLLYLHEEWEQVVLHRDVKASNILLDVDLNGRLSDFGLARLYDHDSNPQTTHVVGTVGYLAPEVTITGRATIGTDVFAFGAFMLEAACGRRPIELGEPAERVILIDWVFECWRKGSILDACDSRLEGDYVVEEMMLVLKLGLLCSHPVPESRPTMRQVMQFLDRDADVPEPEQDRASYGTFPRNETSDLLSSFGYSQASVSSADSIRYRSCSRIFHNLLTLQVGSPLSSYAN